MIAVAGGAGRRLNMGMFSDAAILAFELTRGTMWLPLTVVLTPPTIVLAWYFLNERRLRRKRERDGAER